MSNVNTVRIENIVRKLHAKASDPSIGEAEAALYMAKVNELLIEHNLSDAVLNSKDAEDIQIDEEYVIFPYYTSMYGTLAAVTGRLFFCEVYRMKVDNPNKKIMTPRGVSFVQVDAFFFVGKAHNRAVAMSMFDFFVKTIRRMAKKYTDNQTEQNRFAVGACGGLAHRILAQSKRNEAPMIEHVGEKTNLPALIKSEAEANKSFISEKCGDLKKSRSRAVAFTDAVAAGRKAAQDISLGNQIDRNSEKTRKIA